jgi:hypothetical protein
MCSKLIFYPCQTRVVSFLMNCLILGNDHLHQLTALGTSELYVRLEKFSGGWYYAKYSEFMVATGTDGYRMRLKAGSYQGNAGIYRKPDSHEGLAGI